MTERRFTVVNDIAGPPAPSPRRLSTDEEGQFRLELKDGDIRRIVIIVMDEVHGVRLSSAVYRLHPSKVLDLRQTLRFDQPGLSRAAFFDQLSRIRSAYFRTPVEWRDIQARHLATCHSLPNRLYHEAVECWDGPIALLVAKPEHARFLESSLNRALTERRPDGWEIQRLA